MVDDTADAPQSAEEPERSQADGDSFSFDSSAQDLSRHLISRAFAHDSVSAWNRLEARYRRSLTVIAQLQLGPVLGSLAEAEDLLQEAWLRVIRHLREGATFEYTGPGSLHAWLCLLIRRIAVDKARQAERCGGIDRTAPADVLGLQEERADPLPGPLSSAEDRERMTIVLRAVESLPGLYRQVFIARELERKSHAEVATQCRMTEGNARKVCQRARALLESKLGGRDWEGVI